MGIKPHTVSAHYKQMSASNNNRHSLTTLLESGAVAPAQANISDHRHPFASPFAFSTAESKVVPFGVPEIDRALPHGGLLFGKLHCFSALPPGNARMAAPERGDLIFDGSLSTPHSSFPLPQGYGGQVPLPQILLHVLLLNAVHVAGGIENFQKYIIWIGSELCTSSYPNFLYNALPNHCLFLTPPTEKKRLWAVDTALRSQATFAIIAHLSDLSFAKSRRFTLAAKRHGILLFIVGEQKNRATAAASKWSIQPVCSPNELPRWKLTLLKLTGKQATQREWIIELVPRQKSFCTCKNCSELVLSIVFSPER